MQAVGYNGVEFVEFEQNLENPTGYDLLVEIKAVAINPIDVKVKSTITSAQDTPKILGYDACGVVLRIGEKVSLFKPGDEVFYAGDISRSGSNADQQLVDERIVGFKPKSLNFGESAAIPLTSITAWESIFHRLKVNSNDKGKTILLIGAAGGVGSMAIQFAKYVAGLNVIATASRDESRAWCKKMGADMVLEHHNLDQQFKKDNIPAPDFILCMGDTDDYFVTMADVIKPQGSICLLANATEKYDINILKSKSITLIWEMMFTRSMYQTQDILKQHEILNEVSSLIDNKKIVTTITSSLSPINAQTIAKAHNAIEDGSVIGKLVITN